jgi:hypothetical protein
MMKRSLVICATALVCFALAGVARAMPIDGPFITVSVKPEKIDLGAVRPVGLQGLPAKLTAHIVANCPHHVEASFEAFTQEGGGGSIRPEHTSIQINGVDVPVAGRGVPIASSTRPTPVGGVDVPLNLNVSVTNVLQHLPGTYRATLLLTVMAGS